MKNKELVSIIVPVYNVEQYISKCINSVLKQTYNNIELILIDDGSTDESRRICKDFSHKDSRITFLEQINRGPSAARNKGLHVSQGDFVYFLDSDDYLNSDTIEILVREIKGADLIIAGYKNLHLEKGGFKYKNVNSKNIGFFTKNEFINILGTMINEEIFHYTWNKLYKKEIISPRVSFSEDIYIGEDMIFNINYLKLVKNVKVIDDLVYNHILYNQNSITKKYQKNLFATRQVIHNSIKELLIATNMYKDNTKDEVEKLYIKRIIECFYNLHRDYNHLDRKTRKIEIEKISNDLNVRKSLIYFLEGNFKSKLFGFLIKYRLSNLIYYFSKTIWIKQKVTFEIKKYI